MNRRQMITTTGLGIAGFATGAAFTAPACGVSKEKAVKYVGLGISLVHEAVPLFELLGARDLAIAIDAKVIPALEKLKSALEDADISAGRSTLETVRNVLNGVATGLMSLPPSARRTTLTAILLTVRGLLLTVEAFVDSEMTVPVSVGRAMAPDERSVMTTTINRMFEASKP